MAFSETLREAEIASEHKAIVLGTGGASKAIVFELKRRSIPFIQVSRTPSSNQISYADVQFI
jgi:shikimate dehydrogenase